MADDKTIERDLEESKLDYRARKALLREKREKADKERIPIDSSTISHERNLKKIATKGGLI